MKKVKGFSYNTDTDMDVINHISKQPHQSNYILELIRADMLESKDTNIEEIVKKYMEIYYSDLDK